jgi:pyruvate dehydrogenase E2 component (dihydrolipoamide acetyltransferase)
LPLAAIAARRTEVVRKAHEAGLSLADVADGTFTLTNLGPYGVESFTAIINPPQAAILAVGAITERAVVCDGAVMAQPCVTLSLSADHRVVDGAQAARYLAEVRRLLEDPYQLAV